MTPTTAPTTGRPVETAVWFGPAGRRRFGWWTTPADGRARGAVVLCPPLGEEARCAQRTFRLLGAGLAEAGIAALRLDYDGTGDSVGAQDDPDRVAAWQRSIADAVDELEALGAGPVSVVGMRMGALLAAGALAARGDGRPLVLWDPCWSGRAFVRENQALHNLGATLVEDTADGRAITPGFEYDAATAEALRGLRLSDLPGGRWSSSALLVLTRDGVLPRGAGALRTAAGVEVGRAAGQPALLGVEPNFAVVPTTTAADVVDWLGRHHSRTAPVAVGTPGVALSQFRDPATGALLQEHARSFGGARVFGIVTEPVPAGDRDALAGAPWIVLVNTALELHIGPGRRWVDLARAWAARGFRCLRVDMSGVGYSGLHPGQGEDLLFDPFWLDDLPGVVDALREDSEHDAPIALFGICSASYSAFEAATRRRVDAVYAVNPRVSVPEMSTISTAWDPRRQVALPLAAPVARLTARWGTPAWALWRLYRQVAVWNAPMAAVHRVLATGTHVRVIGNDKDTWGFREVPYWSVLRRRSSRRSPRFELVVDDHVDHALMTQRAQRAVAADATEWLTARYRDRLVTPRRDSALPGVLLDPLEVGVAAAAAEGDAAG